MIHSTALVDPAARLADDVEVGPFTVIGPDVEIGPGSRIGPHVVIKGPTVLGARTRIFQFASVGEECQATVDAELACEAEIICAERKVA